MTANRGIAVAQTTAVAGDVEANLRQHGALAQLAVTAGARLVLFPELSLTGYEVACAAALAFTAGDRRLDPLRAVARDAGITIVVGVPLHHDAQLHIAAVALMPDGAAQVYTKQRLGAFSESAACDGTVPPPEASAFAPGTLDPLIPAGAGTAAIAICADVGRPAHAQRAADRGATAYLASMFVIPSEYERDAATLASYATRHRMLVAMANHGAPTGGLAAAGRSAIWSPAGECLVALPGSGAGVAVAVERGDGWQAQALSSGA